MANKDEWNTRYSSTELIYGTEPNLFLKSQLNKLNSGNLLLPGDGEGRNTLWAAKNGWNVTAFDFSEVAVKKAQNLLLKNNANADITCNEIQRFRSETKFDAIGLIYLHLPSNLRESAHKKMATFLKPNGVIILECYHFDQLKKFSGGPKNPDLFPALNEIEDTFSSLSILSLNREIILLNEGKMHQGEAVVIRMVAKN